MNWLEKMNCSLGYIEANLAQKIDYEMVAQKACCSSYQFQRIFSFVANVTLAEYIRRRRMTLAAFDLHNSKMKVIDIALKYGYESPESFARAFHMTHGVTPTMARQAGTNLKAYPKISFQISIKGDVEMDYRIEKCNGFVVNGIEHEFDMADERCFKEIPKLWISLCASGELEKMLSAANVACEQGKVNPIRSCSYSPYKSGTKFRYMIGIADENQAATLSGYDKISVEAGTWAVFTSETCPMQEIGGAIQNLLNRIFKEWLPTSKYKEKDYQQELYYLAADGKMYCEIWKMVEDAN